MTEPEFVAKYNGSSRATWLNISDRWQRDKTYDLQYAFFNGVGIETWENIWGIWNGMTPRDAEACGGSRRSSANSPIC